VSWPATSKPRSRDVRDHHSRELFLHELSDILYVERELVAEALPKLIK
jgi:hypothetical protein